METWGYKVNNVYILTFEADINEYNKPFFITIYFKKFNSTCNYWVAPATVVFRGKVYNGTLQLSDLDLTPLGHCGVDKNIYPNILD